MSVAESLDTGSASGTLAMPPSQCRGGHTGVQWPFGCRRDRLTTERAVMENKRTLRIVLASPGDVSAERDVVAAVVPEVDGTTCRNLAPPLALELWRWETDSYPGLHLEGPQGIIDDRLRIDQSDILIGVFRRRFGTPTADSNSGTEHEIRLAIKAWKAHGAPRVMLYFAEDLGDGAAVQNDEQYLKVQTFKHELMEQEKALVGFFGDAANFENQLRRHLTQAALQIYNDLVARAEPKTGLVRVSWRPGIVRIRREGYTELLGSFILDMTYEGRTPTVPPHIVILLYFSATITSRPSDPVLFEVERPGTFYLNASTLHGNHVAFSVFQLDSMMPGEKRRFQISNVRCNAGYGSEVQALLVVAGGVVEDELQRVAVIEAGLRFEVVRLDGQEKSIGGVLHQSTSLPPTRVATLRFIEGFPNAFKGRLPAYGAVATRKDEVVTYCSESGYFGTATLDSSGQPVVSNLADSGTRFEATFHNVPTGVRLFVREMADGGNAFFVKSEGSLSSCSLDGRTACELVVRGCSAVAVWEMTSGHCSGVESLDFGVFVAYESCPATNTPLPGVVTVNGSFSPTPQSGIMSSQASSTQPIPRFLTSAFAAELFTIYRT